MTTRSLTRFITASMMFFLLATSLTSVVQAYSPGNSAFNGTWSRTDRPVLDAQAARTWMWGPEANTEIVGEPYAEAPNGTRQVQYFDKARMEITNPNGDQNSIWYVTNGLLVVELITGNMQAGDNTFEARNPAQVNVAGDFDDPTGPTYATFGSLLDAAPRSSGALVTERVDRQGVVTNDASLAGQGINISYVDNVTNHAIAAPFWNFMNSSGIVYQNGQYINQPLFEDPFFATGRPITEAYWAEVKVGGAYKDVLTQCFERRCLTFTPGNPQGFIVEAGNVGHHYYEWRYGDAGDGNDGNDGNDGDDGNDGNDGDETPYEPATDYEFLAKFGLPTEGILIAKPNDVAVAPNGDVYMTDTVNRRILKFNAQGHFLASWGSQGDGFAQFQNPRGIAVDDNGDVYVVDKKQNRIHVFDSNGIFLRPIGTPGSGNGELSSPHGVAVHDGYVFVADQGNNRVQKFNVNGNYLNKWGAEGSGPGQFKAPHGIDVSPSGLVYVADSGNDRVQIFDDAGVSQGSFGATGNGAGQFGSPMSVTVASNGTAYVSDVEHERIAQFSVLPVVAPANSTLQAVSYSFDGFVDGTFTDPTGVDLAPNGRLFVADRGNDRIQVFGSTGVVFGGPLGLIDTWVDDSRGRFSPGQPRSVAVADGYVYATDGTSGKIKVFSAAGQFVKQYGPIVSNNQLALSLQNPADVTVDAEGHIYIADAGLDQIIKLDENGNLLAQLGTPGTAPGQFMEPIAVAVDDGGNLYVADSANRRIQKLAPNGDFITIWYSELHDGAEVDIPIDLTVASERVYVTFSGLNARVEYFDHDGEYLGSFGEFTSVGGVAVDAYGYVYVGDGQGQIQKFTPEGAPIASFGGAGTGDGEFTVFTALRVAVDTDGNVYATDSGGQRIQVFQPAI